MKSLISLFSVIAVATALPTIDTKSKNMVLTLSSSMAIGPSNGTYPITHINTTPVNTTARDFVGPPNAPTVATESHGTSLVTSSPAFAPKQQE
ncbi:hypothetical protein LTR56_021096 [Elasticomyces elasticus]|nr:hypothetical protein LTR56_021096 [Elasticomyces elasticus]KAK3631908.1 hypothetical protein LTR22_020841 [Elasticomyces elasticus]KAK5749570.1 hypothetical protein LTS12_020357 [Elasticomyces elasticus]